MANQSLEVSFSLETPPTIEFTPKHYNFFFVPFKEDSILTLEWIEYLPNMSWGVFNANHPICEIAASTNYKPHEKLAKKEPFCRFILFLLDDHMFYNYYKNKEEPSNFMKYIGHIYIHLKNIGENLEDIIPFNLFFNDIGIISK